MPLEKLKLRYIYIYMSLGVLYITHERLKWKRQLMGTCTTAAAAGHVCGYPTRCPARRLARHAARRRRSPSNGIINDGESSRRSVSKVIKRGANV